LVNRIQGSPSLLARAAALAARPGSGSSKRPSLEAVRAGNKKVAESQPSAAEARQIAQLQQIDQQVRQHERAHLAAGGNLVLGAPTFQYVVGPNGRRYAVGGEVRIDTSPVEGDPEATLLKAQQIRRAALAPTNPSAQDRSVAAKASSLESQARQELLREKLTGASETTDPASADSSLSASPSESEPSSPEVDKTQIAGNRINVADYYKQLLADLTAGV
jgi:hypothetical protein